MWGDGSVASHPLGCVSAGLGCSLELTRGGREEELEGDRRRRLDFQHSNATASLPNTFPGPKAPVR